MDNFSTVIELINNGLFPIAISLVLMFYIYKMQDSFKTVLAENTDAIHELKTMLSEHILHQGGTKDE